MTKEEKKEMNNLAEQYVIFEFGEEYYDSEYAREVAEARRFFRAGYIAGFKGKNEHDNEDFSSEFVQESL